AGVTSRAAATTTNRRVRVHGATGRILLAVPGANEVEQMQEQGQVDGRLVGRAEGIPARVRPRATAATIARGIVTADPTGGHVVLDYRQHQVGVCRGDHILRREGTVGAGKLAVGARPPDPP